MMKFFLKTVLFLCLLQLVGVISPLSAWALPSYKVALLPAMDTAKYQEPAVLKLMDEKIAVKFKYPYYDRLPNNEVQAAIQNMIFEKAASLYNEESMRSLSQTLSADIIIAVELAKARCININSPFYVDNSYVDMDISVNAYIYSRKDNHYFTLTFGESGVKRMSIDTSVYHAVNRLMDKVNVALPYERIPKEFQKQ